MKQTFSHQPGRQGGVTTLLVALLILVSLTLLTFMAAKVSVTEHKISANEYRSKQSFEAAQAGVEYGIRALQRNTATIIVDANNDGNIDAYTANTNQGTIGTLSNNATYTVAMTFLTPGINSSPIQIRLDATGNSDDGTSSRNIRQLIVASPLLANPPTAPVISRQDIRLGGNTNIVNPSGNQAVMSGGTVNKTGSASTSISGATPAGCAAGGICSNQANLQIGGDAFFQRFFGMTKSQYQQIATTVSTLADLSSAYAAGARVFWFEGNLSAQGGIYGSSSAPIILVVHGDIRINGGGTTFNGMIYGTGVYETGAGSSAVNGAVAVEDNVDTDASSLTGTPTLTYDTGLLSRLQRASYSFAKVTGGWRDF